MLVKRRHSRPIPESATIFEKDNRRYARWQTAKGKSKVRPLNRRGDRIVSESPCWYVRLKDPETGKWREWKAFTDRQASQAREVEILKRLERGEVGLVDSHAFERRRPIAKHLMDFEAHLEDKGNTNDHIEKTIARCKRILGHIQAKTLVGLTSEAVDGCLAEFRRGGMSISTSNGYFRAIRSFCLWLVRTKRLRENPLACLTCNKVTDADRKRRRRALSSDELSALIQTTQRSPETFMGLSGADRAMLYLVAANTGLRASELASLTPLSFELSGNRPLVRCQAGYTKNGQEAIQPLRRDVASILTEYLASKSDDQPVWSGKWASHRHGAEMIRNDLTAADVEYEDDHGRVADFHALRHTFISNLARAGIHPRNAQTLARHSTIDLTMNVYTHVDMEDLAGDLESLPSLLDSDITKITIPGSLTESPDLASLTSNWSSLPEHIRQAITTLAGG